MRLKNTRLARLVRNTGPYCAARRLYDEYRWRSKRPVATPYGFQLIADECVQSGSFEEAETRFLLENLKHADVFVDVGANVGVYSCLARSRGVRVVAFEPLPQNLRTLYRNLELNGFADVEVWPIGLAEAPGTAKIYGAHTGASLVKGWAGIMAESWAQTIAVNTLDNVLGSRFAGMQLLVKVDVEGAEFAVLQGAQQLLRGIPKKPVWIVEITLNLHRSAPNPRYAATFEMFWRHGYEARCLAGRGEPVTAADVARWSESGISGVEPYNWCFVPVA